MNAGDFSCPLPRTTDVPHIQLEAVLLQTLDVEALGRHDAVEGHMCRSRGSQGQTAPAQRKLVHALRDVFLRQGLQDGGLASIVKAQHEDSCLLLCLLQLAQEVKQPHR